MSTRAESIRVMHPLFQEDQGGSTPTSALTAKDLRIERIPFEQAKDLNRLWHSRLPLFRSACGKTAYLCFGSFHQGLCYSVAIWSNPVARALPQHAWLELRRLATSPDAPRNTCSRMIRVMELLIRCQCPEIEMLISYQDKEVHTGGIYKASGWTATLLSHGKQWNRPSRYRQSVQSDAPKQQWELKIKEIARPHAKVPRPQREETFPLFGE